MAEPRNRPGAGTVFAGFIAVIFLVYQFVPGAQNPAQPTPELWDDTARITPAQDLIAAFRQNEAAALERFSGPITISGTVLAVSMLTAQSRPDLQISDKPGTREITILYPDSQLPAVKALQVGGPVTVQCQAITFALGYLGAKDCLVKPGSD